MKRETIISIILSVMVLIIIVVILNFSAYNLKQNVLFECYKSNFENITLQGDFSGEFDCINYYKENYEGKWMNECSIWFFSEKLDCHTLCNIDCAFYNKQNGKNMCVC